MFSNWAQNLSLKGNGKCGILLKSASIDIPINSFSEIEAGIPTFSHILHWNSGGHHHYSPILVVVVLEWNNAVVSFDLVIWDEYIVGPAVVLAKVDIILVLKIVTDRLFLIWSHKSVYIINWEMHSILQRFIYLRSIGTHSVWIGCSTIQNV